MDTKYIEVMSAGNWGKFSVSRFTDEEWTLKSQVDPGRSLIGHRGWTPGHLLVLDLQTGEGAIFKAGGYAKADLNTHRIWVCPLYEPFLAWLYEHMRSSTTAFDELPAKLQLNAEFAMFGYRRPGNTSTHPTPEY